MVEGETEMKRIQLGDKSMAVSSAEKHLQRIQKLVVTGLKKQRKKWLREQVLKWKLSKK